VPDERGRAYVVTRDDAGQLDVYAPPRAAPQLTQRFLTSGEKPVQLFDFGAGRRVVAITEPGPGQVYLYDGLGRALGGALPSTGTGVGLALNPASRCGAARGPRCGVFERGSEGVGSSIRPVILSLRRTFSRQQKVNCCRPFSRGKVLRFAQDDRIFELSNLLQSWPFNP